MGLLTDRIDNKSNLINDQTHNRELVPLIFGWFHTGNCLACGQRPSSWGYLEKSQASRIQKEKEVQLL